jgi:predicted RNA-binding protein with PIN domain
MRFLIDGYNVMYAQGLLGKRFGPDGFRKVRTRFLNELADAFGPVDAHLTTVVFDAAAAPEDVPAELGHKGITVIFAVDDADADERIEHLITAHSAPKSLTVVSSDHRIRQAAKRRKAQVLTADEFLTLLESRKHPKTPPPTEKARERELSPGETEYWLKEFADLPEQPDARAVFERPSGIPTDEEIAEIEREVEREFESGE